jgi:hypothetical protein
MVYTVGERDYAEVCQDPWSLSCLCIESGLCLGLGLDGSLVFGLSSAKMKTKTKTETIFQDQDKTKTFIKNETKAKKKRRGQTKAYRSVKAISSSFTHFFCPGLFRLGLACFALSHICLFAMSCPDKTRVCLSIPFIFLEFAACSSAHC